MHRSVQFRFRRIGWLLPVALLIAAIGTSTADAHHAWTTDYDQSRTIRLEGEVRRFEFRNPHSFVHVEVDDGSGMRTIWEVELHAATVLTRMGFRADTFRAGDRVTINGWPGRGSGHTSAYGIGVITVDGIALGDSPPLGEVRSVYLSSRGAERIQGRWGVRKPTGGGPLERRMPLSDAGERAARNYAPESSPAHSCEPLSVPAIYHVPYLIDIRFGPGEVVIHHEAYGITRTVPFGPEAEPVDATGTFGVARARIEDDALVIESWAYAPSAWGLATAADPNGLGADIPSGETKAVSEHFAASDDGRNLVVRYRVEDADYLARPFEATATLDRTSDNAPLSDFVCETRSEER